MAKSQIRINADEAIRKMNKVQINYHVDLMKRFGGIMDEIRFWAADKEIIARKISITAYTRKTAYKLNKLQPVHNRRLTERTGLLKRILKEKGHWKIPRHLAQAKLSGVPKQLKFDIYPQRQPGGKLSYLLRMKLGGGNIEWRVKHETRGARHTGVRRPFLGPAADKKGKRMDKEIKRGLAVVRKI